MDSPTQFECPNCAAQYELVRVEAPPGPTLDREITCLSCGGPLHGREGPFLSQIFPAFKTTRWQTLNLFALDLINEKAMQAQHEASPSKTYRCSLCWLD
jgi:predicted RNA-binding Zn-ribbon protein involved in translation (DUF1610 family)